MNKKGNNLNYGTLVNMQNRTYSAQDLLTQTRINIGLTRNQTNAIIAGNEKLMLNSKNRNIPIK